MKDDPTRKPRRAARTLAALALLASGAFAAQQLDLAGGIFFEAEDYDGRPWYGEGGFGEKLDEELGSGGVVLVGMWKPGALSYKLKVPVAGEYQAWMRCAAPVDTNVRIGANTRTEAEMRAVSVRATTTLAELAGPGAYQWQDLGAISLKQGENVFLLGQGPQRPDCFFLTLAPGFTPGKDFLAQVCLAREAPKGRLLPELRHDRKITQHPKWLLENARRPAYAHLEWDRKNTPQSWAKMAHAAGANCLVGVGELPAGTLDGKMKAYSYKVSNNPAFKYPKRYRRNDQSWVKEFAEAGHAEGLKVVMYGGAWRTLDPILVEHPEWRQIDARGRPYPNGFGSWHSPYRAAYVDRWVKVARECGIDGIMVDMLFTSPRGGDYSRYTVEAFKKRFGVEPPRQEDYRDLTWQRWTDFQTWTREEVMLDVTEALHAVNPEIACMWNQTAGWIFDGRKYLSSRAGKCADGLLEEMGWEVSHGAFDQRPSAWPLQSAWQSLFLHCRTAPGYGQMWHLNGFYTRTNHESLSYSMFANGIAPAVVTGGNWDFLQQVWGHIKPCEPSMAGAALVPYAALHFSEDTLNWYANARGDETRRAYLRSVFGHFQALLETHLPVAIITDDDLEDADLLKRYPVVVLPNTACLSDRQAAALASYVKGGGGLVASFETGLYDENGTRRDTPALAGLLGVKQEGVKGGASWSLSTKQTHEIVNVPEIANGGDPSQGSRDRNLRIQFFRENRNRKARVLKTTAMADVDSVVLNGAGPGYSLLHTRAAGSGRVAYFPPDIGQGYFTYNHPVARLLIERTVRWAAAQEPPMKTDAPMAVQTVAFRKGAELIIHFVNDNSSFGRAAAPNPENFGGFRDEVLPVFGITLTVAGTFEKALLLPEGKMLPVTSSDGRTRVMVPRVDIHAMVLLEVARN